MHVDVSCNNRTRRVLWSYSTSPLHDVAVPADLRNQIDVKLKHIYLNTYMRPTIHRRPKSFDEVANSAEIVTAKPANEASATPAKDDVVLKYDGGDTT